MKDAIFTEAEAQKWAQQLTEANGLPYIALQCQEGWKISYKDKEDQTRYLSNAWKILSSWIQERMGEEKK